VGGLESHDTEKAPNLHQHEVEVPVLVDKQILVVPVLAHHRKLGLRLDLLDGNLDVAELLTDAPDLFLGCGKVLFSSKNLLTCHLSVQLLDFKPLALGIDVELNLFCLILVGVEGQGH